MSVRHNLLTTIWGGIVCGCVSFVIPQVACLVPQTAWGQEVQPASASLSTNTVYRVSPLGELLPPSQATRRAQSQHTQSQHTQSQHTQSQHPHSRHPLQPALDLAVSRYAFIREHVEDYTCTLVKRERIDGELRDYEHIYVKCRNERRDGDQVTTPFSLYMRYLAPSTLRNREILYVAGENDGDMLARKGGRRRSFLEAWLDPHGDMAMRESRYPVTEFGIENLVRRLVEVARDDMQYGECHVRITDSATLDNRSCTAIEVTHPEPRDHFRFHLARILIDNETQLPVHYSAYSWPEVPGGEPLLLEEYTYRKLRVNVGLDDHDFQRENPEYGFRKG